MIRSIGALALAAMCLAGPAAADPLPTAAPVDVGLLADRLAAIGPRIEEDIAAGSIPGAVLLVLRDGKVAYLEAFGESDTRSHTAMAPDSIFRIYSMTKPITSIVVMQLVEEGRLKLSDPVMKYIPSFINAVVAREGKDEDGKPVILDETLAPRAPTVQDLLRHTSGVVYGIFGSGAVRQAYRDSLTGREDMTAFEQAQAIGEAPLAFAPGAGWEYGRSTDILGAIIEVVEDKPLDEVFQARVLGPLGMTDTAFWVEDEAKWTRLAQPPDTAFGGREFFADPTTKPTLLSGGGGLMSTAPDYARFVTALLNGGELEGRRIIGPRTLAFMTSDHLGAIPHGAPEGVPSIGYLPGPGYGFGLGVAVRTDAGLAPFPGSVGDYFWGGYAGTYFWVDPAEDLAVVFMMQAPRMGPAYRELLRSMVYGALLPLGAAPD